LWRIVGTTLHVLDPHPLGEFALHFELGELLGGRTQGLVGGGNRTGTQAVTNKNEMSCAA